MIKTYIRVVTSILLIALSYGGIAPFLVSQNDTLLVAAGIFYATLVVPVVLMYRHRGAITALLNSLKD